MLKTSIFHHSQVLLVRGSEPRQRGPPAQVHRLLPRRSVLQGRLWGPRPRNVQQHPADHGLLLLQLDRHRWHGQSVLRTLRLAAQHGQPEVLHPLLGLALGPPVHQRRHGHLQVLSRPLQTGANPMKQ